MRHLCALARGDVEHHDLARVVARMVGSNVVEDDSATLEIEAEALPIAPAADPRRRTERTQAAAIRADEEYLLLFRRKIACLYPELIRDFEDYWRPDCANHDPGERTESRKLSGSGAA